MHLNYLISNKIKEQEKFKSWMWMWKMERFFDVKEINAKPFSTGELCSVRMSYFY